MNKIKMSFLFVIVLLLSLPFTVLAQDPAPPQVVDTAVGTLDGLAQNAPYFVMVVVGFTSTYITNLLKTASFMSMTPGSKTSIHRFLILLISLIVPVILSLAITELTPLAIWLDDSGIWMIVIALGAIAASQGGFVLESLRKSVKSIAQTKTL